MRRNARASLFDLEREMRRTPLAQNTVDRLFSGEMEPEDAPQELSRVAALLKAASTGFPSTASTKEAQTIGAMVTAARSTSTTRRRRETPMKRLFKVKLAAVAAGALVAGTTGLALAGALPDAAQNGIATAFEKAGITIPNSNADDAGKPADAGANSENTDVKDAIESTEPGLERGRKVSDAASDGNSRVPESVPVGDGNALESPGSASAGANQTGAETSEDASGGNSQAGDEHGQADQHP